MFCPRCGALNDESARYCTGCGTELSVRARDVSEPPQQPGLLPASGQQQVLEQPLPIHQPAAPQRGPYFPAAEQVFKYRLFELPVAVIFLSYLAVAAAWVAFAYLALPRAWEWATEGLIPYSQSSMAPYEDYLAWGFAGFVLLMGFVVIPLVRIFGVREVVLSGKGVIFRDRLGREQALMSRLAEATSKKKATRLRGWDPQGKTVRKVVPQGLLGKKQYREFQKELQRFLSATRGLS